MKKKLDPIVQGWFVVGSLVLLNILGLGLFWRADLTRDHRFSLSKATIDTVSNLEDPLTIRAYFTSDLPPPANTLNRDVKDLLDAYHAASKGKIRYEFIDPQSQETDEDKEKKKEIKVDIFGRALREATSVERELMAEGIRPVDVPVIEDDEPSTKRAYRALLLRYRDKKEVIPMVAGVDGLEYEMTTLIRKLTRKKAPVIALLSGHGGPNDDGKLKQLTTLLKEVYDVQDLDLSDKKEIPDDIAALIVAGPKTPLSEQEQRAIDQFIMKGHAVAFLLGAVDPDLNELKPVELNHGLGSMLEKYGVRIEGGLVLDAECAPMAVSQQHGAMMIRQQVRYPFIPVPRALDPKHPLTQGLTQVVFPFMSPLKVVLPEDSKVKADVLVRSSPKSWVKMPPYDLNPLQRWSAADLGQEGEHILMVALSGPIHSAFVEDPEEAKESIDPSDVQGIAKAENARILVAGGQGMIEDQFLGRPNQVLALNLIDWLVQDEALLAVRARGLKAAPLEKTSSAKRSAAKYANILGLPLLFIGFGIVRWRMREARRTQVTL